MHVALTAPALIGLERHRSSASQRRNVRLAREILFRWVRPTIAWQLLVYRHLNHVIGLS